MPEAVRGKSFAIVEAVYSAATRRRARSCWRRCASSARSTDSFAMVDPAALGYLHMDPDSPVPAAADHAMLGELPPHAIDDLVAVAGPGSGSPLASVELRHVGGALSRATDDAGAIATIPGSYVMFAVGGVMSPEMGAAVEAHLALVSGALAPWRSGSYANFEDRPGKGGTFFERRTNDKLALIRRSVDPESLFLANHAIGGE